MTDTELVDWVIREINISCAYFDEFSKRMKFDQQLFGRAAFTSRSPGFRVNRNQLIELAESRAVVLVSKELSK